LVRGSAPAPEAGPEPSTLSALFLRYAPYVATIAFRILGRPDELDDLVQDVFVDATKSLDQLREPEAIRAWLAAVTVRKCTRLLRLHKFRRWASLEQQPNYRDIEAPGATPEQQLLLSQIYQALEDVPASARVAWILRMVDGESLETVATRCGCSVATVKRRVAVAQLRVEEALG
jgi:RNA polymerase sigma-70 factor (ECF subfamily)